MYLFPQRYLDVHRTPMLRAHTDMVVEFSRLCDELDGDAALDCWASIGERGFTRPRGMGPSLSYLTILDLRQPTVQPPRLLVVLTMGS
jgi:hypothetical protein